jgi:hypothetical protein
MFEPFAAAQGYSEELAGRTAGAVRDGFIARCTRYPSCNAFNFIAMHLEGAGAGVRIVKADLIRFLADRRPVYHLPEATVLPFAINLGSPLHSGFREDSFFAPG